MSSVFQKDSALFLALFRRAWKCQQFIHGVRQTDINRILMKAFQQDLKVFLLSVLCVPVNTGRVKNASVIGQVWKQLAKDSNKEESKETISAGQCQRLCQEPKPRQLFTDFLTNYHVIEWTDLGTLEMHLYILLQGGKGFLVLGSYYVSLQKVTSYFCLFIYVFQNSCYLLVLP